MNIFSLPTSEKEATEFLQVERVLPSEKDCQKGHQMKLYYGSNIYWRCTKCRNNLSIRTGTWFEGLRLPFVTAVRFFYCWAKELTSIKWCEEELGIGHNAAVDWNSYMRETVAHHLSQRPQQKIGGEGK